LIRWVQHPEFDELYDLTADPHEERNVIHQPTNHELVERLRSGGGPARRQTIVALMDLRHRLVEVDVAMRTVRDML
jgi:hypothetical protein